MEFEQIAVHVPDIDQAIDTYNKVFGLDPEKWVRDTVKASNVAGKLASTRFTAHLAFNYELYPGKEFELIQIADGVSGQRYHVNKGEFGISHMGLHVDDCDAWLEQHPDLAEYGVLQDTRTLEHSGTDRRYRYLLLNTHRALGFIVKLIQRLS